MGHKHSKPAGGRCNYDSYKNKIKVLTDKYTKEKSKNNVIEKKFKKMNSQLEIKNADYDKLKNICMVKDKESIEDTGKKIYNMLSKKYKEKVKLMNTQQSLLDKQNKLLGTKGDHHSKLKKKIDTIDNNIVRNDRILELHGEENNQKDKTIFILKIVGIIILLLFIVNVYLTYKNKNN